MEKGDSTKNDYCINCREIGIVPNYINPSEAKHCPNCGAAILYKGVEIKVEGKNFNEVQSVTEQLLKQVSKLYNLGVNTKTIGSTLKTKFMGLFSKRVKCKRFYETQSRTIDVTGLKTGVPQKFDFGLGSFKLDTQYHEASEQLKTLDLLQYGLCNDINGVTDQIQKDKFLQKIIETKTRMLEIIINLNENRNNDLNIAPHFNYLTKSDLVNLLLNFNSDAFTVPFRLEESLINFQNRIFSVSDLISAKLKDVHPDYKRYVIDIFSLLKVLRKISQNFHAYTCYVPWERESIAIDIIRYSIVNKVNYLLSALQVPDRINNDKFLKNSYIVYESENYPDISRTEQIQLAIEEVKNICLTENIETQIVDNYLSDLKRSLPPVKP